ncbi:MAG: helix-turn-helix transcriptional regulator, partial [Clostridia bacterium]|nr:helix-turn-helix transcriptional regulator [Clostridia bacterium]
EICLDEIAEMLYVNKYYFCHLFKNETGKTLKEYVNELRTNKAADLLATTDMSMTEIAGLCGFNDANYYARMFKRLRGVSPTEYRQRAK